MRKVKFRDWEFEVDFELTQKVFKNELVGASENCDCGNCQNFSEQKVNIYPKEIRVLFEYLGIDFEKESEAS